MLSLLLLLAPAFAAPPAPPVVPLRNAHAHNDYAHPRPLLDALANGFCSVEADIFLVKGELYVAHTWLGTLSGRTLEKLYLAPLRQRVQANKGQVYAEASPFYLLIDIKTDGPATYAALDKLLSRYADVFSVVRAGRFERKAVTVVITGNVPRAVIEPQKVRYAAIDGGLRDLKSATPAHLVPHVSANWRSHFTWRGEGAMPEAEKRKLRELARQARERGRLLRFWAAPDCPAAWAELRAAGVGLINTDDLEGLRRFLRKEEKK